MAQQAAIQYCNRTRVDNVLYGLLLSNALRLRHATNRPENVNYSVIYLVMPEIANVVHLDPKLICEAFCRLA